jgi:hypothetical protein
VPSASGRSHRESETTSAPEHWTRSNTTWRGLGSRLAGVDTGDKAEDTEPAQDGIPLSIEFGGGSVERAQLPESPADAAYSAHEGAVERIVELG